VTVALWHWYLVSLQHTIADCAWQEMYAQLAHKFCIYSLLIPTW